MIDSASLPHRSSEQSATWSRSTVYGDPRMTANPVEIPTSSSSLSGTLRARCALQQTKRAACSEVLSERGSGRGGLMVLNHEETVPTQPAC